MFTERRKTMMIRPILFGLMSFVLCPLSFGQTMVYLERAENLNYDEERIAGAQILKGNVVFRHEEALMYCDSAYFYENTNSLDAFGHVRFVQGDTLFGFGDLLYYDGNTKQARMRRNVRLIHGREKENPTILTTDSLNYDRVEGVAYYYTGGEVKDSLNTLTSVRGNYRTSTKQAVFSKEVILSNPRFVLTSDTLLYNTATKIADIVSPTNIIYEKETAQKATLYGEYGQMWEENSRGYATDSALMVDWSDSLHLTYIHADTLFTEERHYMDTAMTELDSTYRRVQGHYGVRVYRDDMQMTCDSMVYLTSDSTMHLYSKPICWSENNQISADSMVVFLVNGMVEHAIGYVNALCVMEDSLNFYNQMSGKEMIAYLEEGEVKLIDMSGNALTVYYPKQDDGEYVGLNTTESSFIRMYIENQEIHHIRFTKETTGILYPMDQIPSGADKLALFFWAAEKRPTGPEDVFRKVENER